MKPNSNTRDQIMGRIRHFLAVYRWAFPLILIVLFLLYYQPRKWFSEPCATVLYDHEGVLLGAKIAADHQWRFPENNAVPEKFRIAVIRGEDRWFMYHPGFNPVSLVRAAIQYFRHGKIISGGSTLSMQVVRMSGRSHERTVWRKISEIVQAFRLELTHSKDEILALYASHAPFGGNIVGLDAASWRYFGIPASQLSWSGIATLAVLPNSPALIYPGKNHLILKKKRDNLLAGLKEEGILSELEYQLSIAEPLPDKPVPLPRLAPHLVEKASAGEHAGTSVKTTVNAGLQERVNEIIGYHMRQLAANEVHNAAAVVVRAETGEILAYTGNTSGNDHANDVDIICSPRSSGSILKPFLYTLALDEGLILPGTLLPDIPVQIGGFMPQNSTLTYDGAVPAREALARSLNIPAVKLLQQYGYEQLYGRLRKMGMTTLVKPADHYGLSLILGGAETTLWDLASIYASMARELNHFNRDGRYYQKDYYPVNFYDKEIQEKKIIVDNPPGVPGAASVYLTFEAMEEVVRPEEELQWKQFASGKRIAWKTGTSYGNRDAWAVGVTPGYVVAVWAGNADGEGRPGLTGIGSAAPILFDIMKLLPEQGWFDPPAKEMELISVCPQSGFRSSALCGTSQTERVPKKGLRTAVCPYHRMVHLDKNGKWQVTSNCEAPEEMIHIAWFVLPPAQEWFFRSRDPFYKVLPPFRPGCAPQGNMAMEMIYPENNSKIYVPVDLDGRPGSTVFKLAHRNPETKVYWNLDDHFAGMTSRIHQLALNPAKGVHRLTLTDESGESLSIRFEIMKK